MTMAGEVDLKHRLFNTLFGRPCQLKNLAQYFNALAVLLVNAAGCSWGSGEVCVGHLLNVIQRPLYQVKLMGFPFIGEEELMLSNTFVWELGCLWIPLFQKKDTTLNPLSFSESLNGCWVAIHMNCAFVFNKAFL